MAQFQPHPPPPSTLHGVLKEAAVWVPIITVADILSVKALDYLHTPVSYMQTINEGIDVLFVGLVCAAIILTVRGGLHR